MSVMSVSDDKQLALKQLFRSGLEGNQKDYSVFLQQIVPLIKRIIGLRLNPSEVDDVLQEILISIHKARHTYDGKRAVLPWVVSIARFRLTDHLRIYYRQKRNSMVDIDDLKEILPDVTKDAAGFEYIEELLQDVPALHKQIILLMHGEGYTAKEVGDKLGMNESAVKVAAHRALKKIRKKFAA